MITDTEIKVKAMQLLSEHLGDVEAERFIMLIKREQFDYTEFKRNMVDEDLDIAALSHKAMQLRKR